MNQFNTRLLVIDDEETVRDSFREILCPKKVENKSLNDALHDLFGDETNGNFNKSSGFIFQLDEAANGSIGLEKVIKSIKNNKPYAVIFVDMRMPGWDGLETVQHIRKIDERAEIIFVTAYSDYKIDQIVEKAGNNIGYHCKPFAVEEVRQLATKGVYDWNKARNLEELINIISSLMTTKWNMNRLLQNVLQQIAIMLGSESGMILEQVGDNYNKIVSIGRLTQEEESDKYLKIIAKWPTKSDTKADTKSDTKAEDSDLIIMDNKQNFICVRMKKYSIIALFESTTGLYTHRLYMLKMFVQNASQAIAKVEHAETIQNNDPISILDGVWETIQPSITNIETLIYDILDTSPAEPIANKLSLITTLLQNITNFIKNYAR